MNDLTLQTGTALFIVYLIPSIVAWLRDHSNWGAIAAVNFFLGWSLIGWVVSLAWSLTDNTHRNREGTR